jgi:hypothetical protein
MYAKNPITLLIFLYFDSFHLYFSPPSFFILFVFPSLSFLSLL